MGGPEVARVSQGGTLLIYKGWLLLAQAQTRRVGQAHPTLGAYGPTLADYLQNVPSKMEPKVEETRLAEHGENFL